MIKHPLAIITILLTIELVILYLSSHDKTKKYFHFIPSVFWIYFLPMILSTFGFIDAQSPIYKKITSFLLPASLLILLLAVDIKAILRLGKTALFMFFAGSLGIVLGAPIVFFLFKNLVGQEMWSGFGALAGSWTGGSANLIAVKEALQTPENVFLPMVVVDTIVPYVWMGMLVACVSLQPWFDRWNHSDRRVLDDLSRRMEILKEQKLSQIFRIDKIFMILFLGIVGTIIAKWISQFLPAIKDVISAYTWVIILVSSIGLSLSLTPVRKLEQFGSTRIGYFCLYFVLTTIGAQANLSQMNSVGFLIAAGFVLIMIHALFLIIAARLLKAPMFLVAAASQANVGGVASAPVVAEIYQPGLASVGLLMAICGNVVGTYLGVISGQLCRMLTNL